MQIRVSIETTVSKNQECEPSEKSTLECPKSKRVVVNWE